MTRIFKCDLVYFSLFLLATISVVTMCGMPSTMFSAEEAPPGISITQGKTQQGFAYLAGGISSNEREMMDELGKAYNVKLSFAEKRGAYLSDVRVVIEEMKGMEIIAVRSTTSVCRPPQGTGLLLATEEARSLLDSMLCLPSDLE